VVAGCGRGQRSCSRRRTGQFNSNCSTLPDLGVDVEDALNLAEHTEV
jgi:hypothetical protein